MLLRGRDADRNRSCTQLMNIYSSTLYHVPVSHAVCQQHSPKDKGVVLHSVNNSSRQTASPESTTAPLPVNPPRHRTAGWVPSQNQVLVGYHETTQAASGAPDTARSGSAPAFNNTRLGCKQQQLLRSGVPPSAQRRVWTASGGA